MTLRNIQVLNLAKVSDPSNLILMRAQSIVKSHPQALATIPKKKQILKQIQMKGECKEITAKVHPV